MNITRGIELMSDGLQVCKLQTIFARRITYLSSWSYRYANINPIIWHKASSRLSLFPVECSRYVVQAEFPHCVSSHLLQCFPPPQPAQPARVRCTHLSLVAFVTWKMEISGRSWSYPVSYMRWISSVEDGNYLVVDMYVGCIIACVSLELAFRSLTLRAHAQSNQC